MKISFCATNPCHLWEMAGELNRSGHLGRYYSGYPHWRLENANGVPVACHSPRTYVTYLLNRLPPALRPDMQKIFRWQDRGFDRWAAGALEACDYVHGLPGQTLEIFRRAKSLGIRTVLNHASGPLWRQNALLDEEFRRAGLPSPGRTPLMKAMESRHREEYALADRHCVASSIVLDQLVKEDIPADRIWVVPYGADQSIFHAPRQKTPGPFRLIYAGQLVLRKGIRTMLDALASLGRSDWTLDCYGLPSRETQHDFRSYRGKTRIVFHGAVPARELAEAFRSASALILPSLEDGFGLVVPQALSCGLPCIVSDAVGAKDLITHRENGSVFPARDSEALAWEITWWSQQPVRLTPSQPWSLPAAKLIEESRAALATS